MSDNRAIPARKVPGCDRGPCPNDSGEPTDVENTQPDATVYFKDIRFGPIDSTYEGTPAKK